MRKKRTVVEKREGIQRTLESYRRFDYDYIPFGTKWKDPDETFDYTGRDRRIGTFLLRFGMAVLAPLVLKVAYVIIPDKYNHFPEEPNCMPPYCLRLLETDDLYMGGQKL